MASELLPCSYCGDEIEDQCDFYPIEFCELCELSAAAIAPIDEDYQD